MKIQEELIENDTTNIIKLENAINTGVINLVNFKLMNNVSFQNSLN